MCLIIGDNGKVRFSDHDNFCDKGGSSVVIVIIIVCVTPVMIELDNHTIRLKIEWNNHTIRLQIELNNHTIRLNINTVLYLFH